MWGTLKTASDVADIGYESKKNELESKFHVLGDAYTKISCWKLKDNIAEKHKDALDSLRQIRSAHKTFMQAIRSLQQVGKSKQADDFATNRKVNPTIGRHQKVLRDNGMGESCAAWFAKIVHAMDVKDGGNVKPMTDRLDLSKPVFIPFGAENGLSKAVAGLVKAHTHTHTHTHTHSR